MTASQIKSWLDVIQASTQTPSSAHSMEKCLWQWVLQAIAERSTEDEIKELASLALRSQEINFKRCF
jgi:hypothetical protein